MSDVYSVPTGGAYAVLFSVLSIFTILAIFSTGFFTSCLPSSVQNLIVAKTKGDDNQKEEEGSGLLATDFFL